MKKTDYGEYKIITLLLSYLLEQKPFLTMFRLAETALLAPTAPQLVVTSCVIFLCCVSSHPPFSKPRSGRIYKSHKEVYYQRHINVCRWSFKWVTFAHHWHGLTLYSVFPLTRTSKHGTDPRTPTSPQPSHRLYRGRRYLWQKECIVIIAEVAAAEIDWELKIRNEKRGKLLNGCKKLSASQLVTEMPREAFFFFVESWNLGREMQCFSRTRCKQIHFFLRKEQKTHLQGGKSVVILKCNWFLNTMYMQSK